MNKVEIEIIVIFFKIYYTEAMKQNNDVRVKWQCYEVSDVWVMPSIARLPPHGKLLSSHHIAATQSHHLG